LGEIKLNSPSSGMVNVLKVLFFLLHLPFWTPFKSGLLSIERASITKLNLMVVRMAELTQQQQQQQQQTLLLIILKGEIN